MDIKYKMPNKTHEAKKQEEFAGLVEKLSIETLNSLQDGEKNVDIAPLMHAIDAYSKFPQYNKAAVEEWKYRLEQIMTILEGSYKMVQEELKALTENNPKLAAYTKNKE